jgi:hypothetical protein
MISPAKRALFLATVALVLIGLVVPFASATAPNSNKLAVRVTLDASSTPAPAGVNVTLFQQGSDLLCNATTTLGGQALFLSSTACDLTPGWYTAQVPAQVDRSVTPAQYLVPSQSTRDTFYASASTLASGGPVDLSGLSSLLLSSTIRGDVNASGRPVANAVVEIRDPSQNGFVISNGTFSGTYSLPAPVGTWTVYAQANVPGASTPRYNFTQAVVPAFGSTTWTNLTITNYLVQGYLLPSTGYAITNNTNVTLFDLSTGGVFHSYSTTGNFFQAGTYASLLAGNPGVPGTRFLLFLSPQGYQTATQYVDVTATAPTQSLSVPVVAYGGHPPTTEDTTITFAQNFTVANVTSQVTRGPGSAFTALPNASVGNLYAQIALDFGSPSSVNASAAEFSAFQSWLAASGPVYPADVMGLAVNSTSFVETGNFHLNYTAVPTNTNFDSSQVLGYQTTENYTRGTAIKPDYSSYQLTLGFRYPIADQALNYTVVLPPDYVLGAQAAAPAGTTLTPAGPGRTWTAFTLSALHSPGGDLNATTQFTVYRFQNVSAIVNVTSSNFAFSSHNVLNRTRANYTVVVGAGQNVSLTAANSLIPSAFNVTAYRWTFGDGTPGVNTTNVTIHHTYAQGGSYNGTLTLVANGGQTSVAHFRVLVDSVPPSPRISTNASAVHWLNPAHTLGFTYVNYSTSLRFNATGSTDTLYPGSPVPGIIADAIWNISAGPTYASYNFSLGAGARVFSNVTYAFLGAGPWLNHTVINGTTYPTKGWVYRVSETLYDAGGNRANASLWVLVNDTEKPRAIGSLQNSKGQNVTTLVEGANETAQVTLIDKYSYDPGNGSIAAYRWTVNNSKGSGFKPRYFNETTDVSPSLWLPAAQGAYTFNLTVTDLAGNNASIILPLTVSPNRTLRPLMQVSNFTTPTTLTAGSSYTIWANVTNAGGNLSVAENVSVTFYLTSPGASNHRTLLGGSPGAVRFYGYTNGVVNGTIAYTGLATLKHNQTLRAEVTFTAPGNLTGGRALWVNATATNEFPGDYVGGANLAQISVTVNPSPTNQYLEYGIVAAVGIVIIILVYFAYRRRARGSTSGGGRGSGRAGKGSSKDDEEDDAPPRRGSKGKDDDD